MARQHPVTWPWATGQGLAWVRGEDPYDLAVLTADVRAGGADQTIAGGLQTLLDVYFPTTLPSFAPLAPLSWDQAKFAVLALNVAASVFIAWGLVRLLGWRRTGTDALASRSSWPWPRSTRRWRSVRSPS